MLHTLKFVTRVWLYDLLFIVVIEYCGYYNHNPQQLVTLTSRYDRRHTSQRTDSCFRSTTETPAILASGPSNLVHK